MNAAIQSLRMAAWRSRNGQAIRPLGLWTLVILLIAVASMSLLTGCAVDSKEWEDEVTRIVWVDYSPPNADPDKGTQATPESISEDIAVLRGAGFTGLVTYSSLGVLGRELPALAESQGFDGLIMGIWDPLNQEELAAAKAASKVPIVLGFCVGNEGLGKRYRLAELSAAIGDLRRTTGKRVATTEEIDDYWDEALIQLGDWVFPNAHPYFHSQLDPDAAARWTANAYEDLIRRTSRFVMLKEVGLPTAGDSEGKLSEAGQEQYYLELERTSVRFVYFEAFDQPWKTQLPVEPHWGIFQSNRTPKLLGLRLMGEEPPPSSTPPTPLATPTSSPTPTLKSTPTSTPTPTPALKPTPARTPTPTLTSAFYVYRDVDSQDNHYEPTGYMGDTGDIHMNEAYEENPHSGQTSMRVVYDARGRGPNECAYSPPCKWAGVYWQEPPNNWGENVFWKDRGFDLSFYNRLVFWARTDKACTIEFKVGGIDGPYGDSLPYPRGVHARLSENWQEFQIDLSGANLKHIIGGFVWVTNWDTNPDGAIFYLDDIRFERK